jgi:hypothetical protein
VHAAPEVDRQTLLDRVLVVDRRQAGVDAPHLDDADHDERHHGEHHDQEAGAQAPADAPIPHC